MKRMTKFDRLREEGKEEGKKEGMQDLVLRLLANRFGQISERIRDRVRTITSAEELTQLADRVTQANSLQELGLA